jgi:hypothetical protein
MVIQHNHSFWWIRKVKKKEVGKGKVKKIFENIG